MSYFKIGWQWLRQQFRRDWPKMNWFWLDPSSDPEPAIASRKKANKKKRVWKILYQRPPNPHQQAQSNTPSLEISPHKSANQTDSKPIPAA